MLLLLIKEKIKRLQEETWMAEIDRILRPQYEQQIGYLHMLHVVEVSADVPEPWFIGVDGERCVLPSYAQIFLHILEKKEEYREKFDQGFTKLLLTPFGLEVTKLSDGLQKYLKEYKTDYERTSEFKMPGDPKVHIENYAIRDEAHSRVVHHPKRYNRSTHEGKTKADILKTQRQQKAWNAGWRIGLVQAGENDQGIVGLVMKGEEEVHGTLLPREDLRTMKTPADCFADLLSCRNNPTSPYHSEEGFLVEDWICAFVTNLEETGRLLDRDGRFSLCLGAYMPVTDSVISPCFIVIEKQNLWGVGMTEVRSTRSMDENEFVRTCVQL